MNCTARILPNLELLALDLNRVLHGLQRLMRYSTWRLPRINRVVELKLISVVAVLRRKQSHVLFLMLLQRRDARCVREEGRLRSDHATGAHRLLTAAMSELLPRRLVGAHGLMLRVLLRI